MLKQTVSYTDYNDDETTEELYFNLSRSEMLGVLDLQPRIAAWQQKTSGLERDLTTKEVLEFLDILRTLIHASYGERSTDGKRFKKSPEILESFQQSAAYDELFMSLMMDPARAVAFMTGILPQNLVAQVENEMSEKDEPEKTDGLVEVAFEDLTEDELSALSTDEMAELMDRGYLTRQTSTVPVRSFESYSRQELLDMTDLEFKKLVGSNNKNMTRSMLQVAMARRQHSRS